MIMLNNLPRCADNEFPPGRAGHASIEQTAGSYQATHATHECSAGPHIGDKPPTPNSGAGAAKNERTPPSPPSITLTRRKLSPYFPRYSEDSGAGRVLAPWQADPRSFAVHPLSSSSLLVVAVKISNGKI